MVMKSSINLLSRLTGQSRGLVTKPFSGPYRSLRPAILGTGVVEVAGFEAYKFLHMDTQSVCIPQAQKSVISHRKNHALFFWIELSKHADFKKVSKVAAGLQKMVDGLTGEGDDEILAGVGFGPNFYTQIGGKAPEDYKYTHRKGKFLDMPNSGGDVFIHAKCNTSGKLFELAQLFVKKLPKDSVKNAEDVYGFDYKHRRDLSGFVDDEKMERWIGRKKDETEILDKKSSSHIARIRGGSKVKQEDKPYDIVRQAMPFGTVTGDAGLFFIGYAASPKNFNFMLDRMVGAGKGAPEHDDTDIDELWHLSCNVKGTFWYFPGIAELKQFE